MENSRNRRVQYLTIGCMATPRSIIGTNLRAIGRRPHIDQARLEREGFNKLKRVYEDECTERDYIAISLIGEVIKRLSKGKLHYCRI